MKPIITICFSKRKRLVLRLRTALHEGFLFTNMAQQADIDNIVNQIVNDYTGRSIAYFGSYPNECSVPVAYYVDKLRGTSPVPGMANNRADGWGVSFPNALSPHFVHETYQPGRVYPRGTILMWNSPHIAIVLHSDGSNNVQVFEQNADPNGSVCGTKNRIINNAYHTCTYALIPIISVPPSPPIPAPIAPPVVTPVVVPDPPNPPSGALPVPIPITRYSVVKTILAFLAYTKAASHEDANTTLSEGSYYLCKETGGMLLLKKSMDGIGYWINPADNILDPIVETPTEPNDKVVPSNSPSFFKSSYSSFSEDRKPVKYVFLDDYVISDLSGYRPAISAKKYSEINIYGTFVKDGKMYYRPKLQSDTLFQYYFGIPALDPFTGVPIIEPYDDIYNTQTTTADHIAMKTITPIDRLVIIGETVGKWWDIITNKKH